MTTKEQAQQLKSGDKVTVKFNEPVTFWGGVHFKADQKLKGKISRIANTWLGVDDLHIPYRLIEIVQ